MPYRAPELLAHNKGKKHDLIKVDIWALGLLLYFMTYGVRRVNLDSYEYDATIFASMMSDMTSIHPIVGKKNWESI